MTGEQLRKLRADLTLTQEGLARLLGVSFATVNRWETMRSVSGPRGAVLMVLQALQVGLDRDPLLAVHLREWALRGQPYLMHQLFSTAFGGREATPRGRLR